MISQLIVNLPTIFRTLATQHNLPAGDFPDIAEFQLKLAEMDFKQFMKFDKKLFDSIEAVLSKDIPALMNGED